MARTAPHVVATRLTQQQLRAVQLVAASRNTSISGIVQHALVSLAAGAGAKADSLFRDLLKALGIEPDAATAQEIDAAVRPLIEAIALPEDLDPLASGADDTYASQDELDTALADAVPEVGKIKRKLRDKPVALSKQQIAACARNGLAPTPANWAALTNSAVHRLGSPRAADQVGARLKVQLSQQRLNQIKAAGMTPEEFERKRATAVRRSGESK